MGQLTRGSDGVVRKRATPSRGFGPAKRACFLDELAATCNIRAASRAAGIEPSTARRARARDGAFAELWAAAFDEGRVRLEEELLAFALGHMPRDDNPVGERVPTEGAAFNPELALKVLALRAKIAPGGKRVAAAAAPTQAEVDAMLLERLEAAARTQPR